MKEIGLDLSDYGKNGYKVSVNHCGKCKKIKIVYVFKTAIIKPDGKLGFSNIELYACQKCIMEIQWWA